MTVLDCLRLARVIGGRCCRCRMQQSQDQIARDDEVAMQIAGPNGPGVECLMAVRSRGLGPLSRDGAPRGHG